MKEVKNGKGTKDPRTHQPTADEMDEEIHIDATPEALIQALIKHRPKKRSQATEQKL